MMMSSSQEEEILNTNIILPNKDPPEAKITTIVAVMRGRPKLVTTANAVTSTRNKN
jgi:hypothetical protein